MSKIMLAIYVLSATTALILLKLGTADGLPIAYINHKIHFSLNPVVVSGFVMYIFSFLSYMHLISKNDLGYIIPFAASFVYIILFIASYFIFKESFSTMKIFGIGLILVGIIFLNLGK